jgi:hypothetical protein
MKMDSLRRTNALKKFTTEEVQGMFLDSDLELDDSDSDFILSGGSDSEDDCSGSENEVEANTPSMSMCRPTSPQPSTSAQSADRSAIVP